MKFSKAKRFVSRLMCAAILGTTVLAGAVPAATGAAGEVAYAAPSAPAARTGWKFDFGPAGKPYGGGFVPVAPGTAYTQEAGYGFAAALPDRNAYYDTAGTNSTGHLDDGYINFSGAVFYADVPNGEYKVTVYGGDNINDKTHRKKTQITLEGIAQSPILESIGVNVHQEYTVTVDHSAGDQDGHLTLAAAAVGSYGYAPISAILIEAVKPATPTITNTTTVSTPPSVTLTWTSVSGAVYYDIFRNTVNENVYNPVYRLDTAGLTQPEWSYTDTTAAPGTYQYRVAAVNAQGSSSEPSAPAQAVIEEPSFARSSWKFDFGLSRDVPMEGYLRVHPGTVYAAATGYGFATAIGGDSSARNRGGTDGDFVLIGDGTFLADVPNGDYKVTVSSGDTLAGTSTTRTVITLEGAAAGTVQARQAITVSSFTTTVSDGQLTIGITGNQAGYVNSILVEPLPVEMPAGLTVQVQQVPPAAILSWTAAGGASTYTLQRKEAAQSSYTSVATVSAPATTYTDTAVELGKTYLYRVAAVNGSGQLSAYTEPVTAEISSVVAPPAAPSGVTVSHVGRDSVQLKWTASPGAASYKVYKSSSAGGTFAPIGTAAELSYTDTAADTQSVWFYRVAAVNTAGESSPSATVSSSIYTAPQPLPEGDVIRFDFGPGAQAEGYLKVQATAAYSQELKYGFKDTSLVTEADRGISDPVKSDFVAPGGASFLVDLPNGDYSISLVAGDETEASAISVTAEDIVKVQETAKAAGEYLSMGFNIALVDGQLKLDFAGAAPKLNALVITKLAPRTPGAKPTVYLAGDSTVQTYDSYYRPQAGWGQMIARYFTEDAVFVNKAIGGRSSKSFLVQGRLDEILLAIKPGDYFLIQFGHNDATISVPERYASPADYKMYLRSYIAGAVQRGATPVLVTPMGRFDYNTSTGKFNVSFPEYVAAMKEVAAETGTKLVDLSTRSVAYYDSIGPEGAQSVFLHVQPGVYEGAYANGAADNTHFQEYGAIQLARLLAEGIKELGLPLSDYVKNAAPPAAVPDRPAGLTAGSVSNSGTILRWNAAEGAEIYKVYKKSAADSTYILAGSSTIPSITLGGLSEGVSYTFYVTGVNGKGESLPSEPVVITTKSAQYKYDFGQQQNGGDSPLEDGYIRVDLNTLYNPVLGYGITNSSGMIARDRGTGSNLARDWLGYFNNNWEFKVDLPNGTYAVKLYVGDMAGSARTDVSVEGIGYGTVAAGKNSVAEKVINNIKVRDGQINFLFGGSTGIVNGLEITPVMLAPTGFRLDSLGFEETEPVIKLVWTAAPDAAGYRIYRQIQDGSGKAVALGDTTETFFTDRTADIGTDYLYTLCALDTIGSESLPSDPVAVSTIDPNVTPPAAPEGLTVGQIGKQELALSWNAVSGAQLYRIYRAEKADGPYRLVGSTRTASYTDTAVLTTIKYYYRLGAVNTGGQSPLSIILDTPAVTVLSRQMEYLDRSLVAIQTDNGVYLGWKLLGTDPDTVAFNLYRDGVKLNPEPLTGATNYVDASGTGQSVYSVRMVMNGQESAATSSTAAVWQQNYLSIPLQKPADGVTPSGEPYTYSAGDASAGDLDGDGKYEIVMLWSPSNAHDNSQAGYTGNVYMDAYKLDGTRLWRMDLGVNIRAGAHYTQFLVYDFDGDGKAEIAFKTADGTIDGQGRVIGDASADYRNSSGYILLGNEYLSVFEGLTGKVLDTVDYTPARGDVSSWGDGYGNRVDRFLATVAYLDGERPSMVFSRGYYDRTALTAYNFRDGKISMLWKFDTLDEENNLPQYKAQGNHNISAGDVDGDGKDEINFGAMAFDDDGTVLYTTGLGHGDAHHFGDLDPLRPGLELFDVHEHTDSPYGMELRDAATGEIIWGIKTGIDTGRGLSADIDPNYPGEEFWSATITNAEQVQVTGLHSTSGELISQTIPTSTNFAIWWDGDLLRELLDANRIDKWDYVNKKTDNLFTAVGASSNNGTKSTPALQADLLGDWREEVVWKAADSSELRIYSTVAETTYRIHTLMHDPIYRTGVAWQNVAYNQPPHTGFYLGAGMETPAKPNIYYAHEPTPPATAPTVTLEGADLTKAGTDYTLTLRVAGAAGIQAADITLVYDAATFTLTGVSPLLPSLQIADRTEAAGTIRLKLASLGAQNAVNGEAALVAFTFSAKGSSLAVANFTASSVFANAEGNEASAAPATKTVTVSAIDRSVLQAMVENAAGLLEQAVEGYENGQYILGAKTNLQAAISSAQAVLANNAAGLQEIIAAASSLDAATQAFAGKRILPATGDISGTNGLPDGKISIGDLGYLAARYGMKATSPEWSQAQRADINGNGEIDLYDLAFVAKRIQ